jgi:hypothetical protein
MRSRRTPIIVATLIAAIAVMWWFVSRESRMARGVTQSARPVEPYASRPDTETSQRSSVVAPKPQIVAERPALVSLPLSRGEEPSRLADELHSPERTGAEDLSVAMNLLTQYRLRFKGYPVGEDNASFVNALSGNNPGRLAFISRNHPAIDAQGQLLDRWGKPFFFHLLGRDELEIRSAGPDRELYTPDDLLAASPGLEKATLASDSP